MALCSYAAHCSGCSYWGIPQDTQIRRKMDVLRVEWETVGLGSLPEMESLSLRPSGLRDRLDFRYEGGAFGLFDRNRKEILDLNECLQLSQPLHDWHQDFRGLLKKLPRHIYKASIRLRVAPSGQRGTWLDLSNEDVRDLFIERDFLTELLKHAMVEIGQRRKQLQLKEDGSLSLAKEPRFYPWGRTWQNETPVPLYSRIADFSQPGDAINKVLVQNVVRHINNEENVVDWGTGSGNFCIAAAGKAKHVLALDVDKSALLGLQETIRYGGFQGADRIEARDVDFHRVGVAQSLEKELMRGEEMTWIADPPRSGAGPLFFEVPETVTKIISVSCFMESFIQDSFELSKQGFKADYLALVEQFPQTHHAEWISVWRR